MDDGQHDWQGFSRAATAWLRRCSDDWTRRNHEDLAQDAVVAAWRWSGRMQHPARFVAAFRTIVWRGRHHARRRVMVRLVEPLQDVVEVAAAAACEAPETYYTVAGRRCPATVLQPYVDAALARLRAEDRRILAEFYGGNSCAEIAARRQRSNSSVQARLHRARQRVRKYVEACARAAGGLDDGS